MVRQVKLIIVVTAILFLAGLDADAQCAMCKATMESSGAGTGGVDSYGLGINNGIIYLVLFPYIILFIFFRKRIFTFFKEFRALWNK